MIEQPPFSRGSCQIVPPEHVGDKGQRYEVRMIDAKGADVPFGWTEYRPDAERMCRMVEKHPSWSSPRIIDRKGSLI